MPSKAKANTGKKVANKPKKSKTTVRITGRPNRLDAPAREFAKLLNDPCYGNLVNPVYSSSGSGNFVRVESDFILGAEATSVGAALLFTPGYVVPAGSLATNVIVPTTVVNSDTGAITWTASTNLQPGLGMVNMLGSARCVAACVQVSYVGSELSRAGVVSLSQTTRAVAVGATTTAQMRSMAQRVVRMPDGVLEVKMAPNGATMDFIACDAGLGSVLTDDLPTLCVGVSGIPGNTGVRFRLVQVLEWLPKAASGAITNSTQSESTATLTMVLAELKRARPDWQYELLTGLGAYAAKALTWI